MVARGSWLVLVRLCLLLRSTSLRITPLGLKRRVPQGNPVALERRTVAPTLRLDPRSTTNRVG